MSAPVSTTTQPAELPALNRIREKLTRAGARIPIDNQGTVDSAIKSGLSIAMMLVEDEITALAASPSQQAGQAPAEGDCATELRVIGDALLAAHDHLEMHKLERSHCNSAAAIREGLATYSAWKKRADLAALPNVQPKGTANFPAPDLRGIDGATLGEWRTLGLPAKAVLIQESDLPKIIERACLSYVGPSPAPAHAPGHVAWVVRKPGGYCEVGYQSSVLNKLEHGTLLYTAPQRGSFMTREQAIAHCRNRRPGIEPTEQHIAATIDAYSALFGDLAPAEIASPAVAHTQAALDVLAERQRQISVEGWTPEHDDEHHPGALPHAAAMYAVYGGLSYYGPGNPPDDWPWTPEWWKPSTSQRRNLVKAGALILAEIERLDRLSDVPVQGSV